MNESTEMGFDRKRSQGIWIELVPFASLPVWLAAVKGDSVPLTTIAVVLTLASGLGWALSGRWRAGIAVAVARGVAVIGAYLIWIATWLNDYECSDCHPMRVRATFTGFLLICVLTTIGSAATLAWVTRHGRSAAEQQPR